MPAKNKHKLQIEVLTLFPKLFVGPLNESMIRLAQEKGLVKINIHNLRDWTSDRHKTCDDKPFGGGPGMVMKVEPIDKALAAIQGKGKQKSQVVMLSPRGKAFTQETAQKLSRQKKLIFICGHYEGVDERVHANLVDEEISIGEFITTGGEFPVLCVMDAIIRLVPGVLGNQQSLETESFHGGLLEYPQYTRPQEYRGWEVPPVLRKGAHKQIEEWRKNEALVLTRRYRPDLLQEF